MSAENTATRGGRDPEKTAQQPSNLQLPQDLASQYQVRVIEPTDGSERRVGMFLPKDRDVPSIEIGGNGDRIVARNEDPETIAALVKIATHNGWEGIDVDGSPAFRKAVWAAGSREGLTVRGYEPEFGEQARMEERRRSDAARRDRAAPEAPAPVPEHVAQAPTPEQTARKPVVEVGEPTVAARSIASDRIAIPPDRVTASAGAGLSDHDRRLLLTLSSFTQDREALTANVREGMDPMEREFQYERLDLNRAALEGALEQALESPALVSAFSRSGYEPDDLRQMARDGAWDNEVADAIYLVRSGRNRRDVAKDGSGLTAADELAADREDRAVAESTLAPEREPSGRAPDRPRGTSARRRGGASARERRASGAVPAWSGRTHLGRAAARQRNRSAGDHGKASQSGVRWRCKPSDGRNPRKPSNDLGRAPARP